MLGYCPYRAVGESMKNRNIGNLQQPVQSEKENKVKDGFTDSSVAQQLSEDEQLALIFCYNELYSEYKSIKRRRSHPLSDQLIADHYREKMLILQKLFNKLGVRATYTSLD